VNPEARPASTPARFRRRLWGSYPRTTSTHPAKARITAASFLRVSGSWKTSAERRMTKTGAVYRRMAAVATVVRLMAYRYTKKKAAMLTRPKATKRGRSPPAIRNNVRSVARTTVEITTKARAARRKAASSGTTPWAKAARPAIPILPHSTAAMVIRR